jgi:hypothetical protein
MPFDELIADIARRPEYIKPERNVQRKLPRKKKFFSAKKPSLH